MQRAHTPKASKPAQRSTVASKIYINDKRNEAFMSPKAKCVDTQVRPSSVSVLFCLSFASSTFVLC